MRLSMVKTVCPGTVLGEFGRTWTDPTVITGGIINDWGSNARLGKGPWMIVEADESDGSFLRLDGTIAVVTNIDPEHLDHYGDFDGVKRAFVEFVHNSINDFGHENTWQLGMKYSLLTGITLEF